MNKMTICKTCSKEVATSAKVCPNCGAKLKGCCLLYTSPSPRD